MKSSLGDGAAELQTGPRRVAGPSMALETAIGWPRNPVRPGLSAAGLARVHNVFQMTRRPFNAFERPLGTASSQNAVWHG